MLSIITVPRKQSRRFPYTSYSNRAKRILIDKDSLIRDYIQINFLEAFGNRDINYYSEILCYIKRRGNLVLVLFWVNGNFGFKVL